VNDEGALGRVTTNVPNPEKEGEFLDVDELTAVPHPVQTLLDEKFRAVKVAAGDNISAAISDAGELRVWGSFRVSVFSRQLSVTHKLIVRITKALWAFPVTPSANFCLLRYSSSKHPHAASQKNLCMLRRATITSLCLQTTATFIRSVLVKRDNSGVVSSNGAKFMAQHQRRLCWACAQEKLC
jgi:hypothetical protein